MKLSIPILLFILIQTTACKKMLDKKPASYLSTPETLEDLQALLDENATMNFARTPSIPESSTDDFFLL